MTEPIRTIEQLEERLSEPTPGVIETLRQLPGDVAVLGVGGKMGPTLARMVRRAINALGRRDRVFGIARFSTPGLGAQLQRHGVEPIACDLLDREAVARLPDTANVIFMAGQKFGTTQGPELTWAMNTLVPAHAAERYKNSRIVAFSTGCVYPLVPIASGGSRETDELGPPGDYANSCVGRERIFTYFSRRNGTPVALIRLNYAIDLRYGVLLDVALKVWNGEPVDVTMGYVNVIWQRDANAYAIQSLAHAASPPFILNVTGPELISVRELAQEFARRFQRPAKIIGQEAPTAWLNNASRAHQLFGLPTVGVGQLIDWVADWVQHGGPTLGKPTHFEVRNGKF
ncbi:MAG: NAD(P)-dependent oxidoreductase [Verrucomicrobiae bacterium]|nr:NAD(P)-dependent oxidoreductase [Verrucomicrobiae bacterium]